MKTNMKKPVMIPSDKIRPFEGHPYKVKDNGEMNSLIESIQSQGILAPIIIRPIESTDEYEVISRHRRLHASIKAGIKEVPALIYAISRDEAAIMLVDSNLHREHILPSEKAFSYKLKYDALKHQGTSCQVGTKSRTDEIMSERVEDRARQIQRYIRLTHLIPDLLDLMDEGKIAFSVGVELSYLDDQLQYDLLNEIELNDCHRLMHSLFVCTRRTTQEFSTATVSKSLCLKSKRISVKCSVYQWKQIRKYAPKATEKQLEDFVIKACKHYRKYLQRQRDAR